MQGEVQLIVGANGTELQLTSAGVAGDWGYNMTSPHFIPLSPASNYITVGTQIILGNSGDPNTYTPYATIEVTSVDYDAATFEFIILSGTIPNEGEIYCYWFVYTLVTISGQVYLDLFENESISQNWKFQDLSNFTAQGAFSREFRIPFSERNQVALGALFDVNVTAGDANYFHYKLPAEIRVDTLPIATGYIRVRKVYRQLNRINEVEIAFYAETPDLVRNIGEKKLSDIVDLTTLDEVVQYDNVTNPSATRIWTIADRGQLWSEGGEANTRSLTTAATPVFSSDLTPALNWWYLFEKIVTEAGFELVAGTLQNILEGYWMPWLNSQRLIGSDTYNELFFLAETSVPIPLFASNATIFVADIEIYDNGNDYNPLTYTYTTPADGYYTFQVILNIAPISNSQNIGTIQAGLVVDGINILAITSCTYVEDFPNTQQRILTFTIGIDAGSTVQLLLEAPDVFIYVPVTGSWSLIGVQLSFGQTIYYNLNAPDMKQIDFITDVIKMHNCAIVPDRAIANKLYVVPQNSYLGSGNVIDWTSKLDTSKDIVISSTSDIQKGKFQYTYTAGEDIFSQQYKNANRIYGDYEVSGYTINPDTAPSDFAIGDQKIQLVTRSLPAGVVNGSGYVMPMFFDSSLKFKAPGPHCLFEAGSYDIALYDDSISTVVTTSVPSLNHYSVINADIDDYDLNFAPEVPPHPIITNPYNNLFNLYWRTYMNALYSPDARMMEAFFALDLKDVLTFQFSDKVWIENSYWRILQVSDYKVGMQESTKVTLLKFLEDVEDCFSTPVSVSVNGEVNFEDAQGDPVEPSQDCCTRYGYNWDEANGICWAFTPTGDRPNSATSGTPTNPSPRPTTAAVQNRSIINSVINGNDITIAQGNSNMLAVGNKLALTAPVSGSNLLGKNVTTNLPGMHLGGGWKNGNTASAEKGWAQSGEVIMHYKDAWVNSQIWDLLVEGNAGMYIEIPNDTVWSCIMKATIINSTNQVCTGQYVFELSKFASSAQKQGIITLNEFNGTPYTFTFNIDTATNPAQHRLNLQVTGLGISTDDFIVTASIQYQQSKIT